MENNEQELLRECPFCKEKFNPEKCFEVIPRHNFEHTHQHSIQLCCPACGARGPYIFADYDITRIETCNKAIELALKQWNNKCCHLCHREIKECGCKAKIERSTLARLNEEDLLSFLKLHFDMCPLEVLAKRICDKFGGSGLKALTDFCQLEELDENELYSEWLSMTGWRHNFDPNKILSPFEVSNKINEFISFICSKFGTQPSKPALSLEEIKKLVKNASCEWWAMPVEDMKKIKINDYLSESIHAALERKGE